MANNKEEDDDNEETIKSLLEPYLKDLWIECRFKLKEILADLQGLRESRIARDYIQFIVFLEEHCSGLQFKLHDKQWGELLNLMMISRKLNHKSVKFKDILANKQQIELAAYQIKNFTATIQLGHAIESGLQDLEQLIQLARLNWNLPNDITSTVFKFEQLTVDKLMEAKNYLHDKCQPLMYSLKLALNDERIGKDLRLIEWRKRETRLSSLLKKMLDFVTAMIELQSKLTKMRYLNVTTKEVADDDDDNDDNQQELKSKVRIEIEMCRIELIEIQEFYQKLLQQIANRAIPKKLANVNTSSSILLIRLFEPKEYINSEDIRLAIKRLNECQRKLDEIMQNLKREFGRFYFLNDLELLTVIMIDTKLILSTESKQNKQIICKLFNNSIESFQLDDHRKCLVSLQSPSGEIIRFSREDFVPLKKSIQVYSLEIVRILNEVQRKLRKTLKSMLIESVNSTTTTQVNDIYWSLPVQLINLSEFVKFCSKVENSLASKSPSLSGLIDFYELQSRQLNQSINQRPEVSLAINKLSAAKSMLVHFVSLLMMLQHKKVQSAHDWLWQKQVRYYLIEDNVVVRIADAQFDYKFDYLAIEQQQAVPSTSSSGTSSCSHKRLISTKITERCFLLASQAVYHLRLGANPFGPAGGGKTETIKALGHFLGQQVIVHNCDESNDIESLDKLIWGLAHTGLWGCFDEFNRLSSSTMSVISATLELVQSGIRENKTMIMEQQQQQASGNDILSTGSMMCIGRDSAFFITLNPASGTSSKRRSYKGRRRLPANLRSLFLPISMVQVQIDSIVCENLLAMSSNEQTTTTTTNKDDFIELGLKTQEFLLRMKRQELGNNRCEWDLRLVMAVLLRLKLLIESSRQAAFNQLLADSLSIEIEPRLSQSEFVEFEKALKESGLDLSSYREELRINELDLVEKRSNYLSKQLETRTGVLLVGPPRSGKSSIWRKLFSMDQQSRWIALNPKFCSHQALFGGFIEDSLSGNRRKWRDGYFTSKVREALDMFQERPELRLICIVLDGPIDPDWVESLNSVLDDNRVLTLGSGERLLFSLPGGQSIKLLLETDNIDYASPATISRLGLVYFDQPSMGVGGHQLNQVQVTTKEVFEQHLLELANTWQLLIICGQQLDDRRAIVDCFSKAGYDEKAVSTYSCNQYSNSSLLIDLLKSSSLAEATQKIHLIHNVHLIDEQDQWGAKSFLELLRFSIDYGGYYNDADDEQFRYIDKEVKFVLTCESLSRIDQRLAGKSNLVINLKLGNQDTSNDIKTISIDELLKQEDALLIVKNINHLSIKEFNQSIIAQHKLKHRDDSSLPIRLFNSSSVAKESLECLQKQKSMNGDNDELGRNILYVLHNLELELMYKEIKAQLLHLLNFIVHLRGIKFIYICHGNEIPPELITMAPVFLVEMDHQELLLQSVRDTSINLDEQTMAWLVEKISSKQQAKNHDDKEQINSLVGAFVRLYKKSSSNLLLRQKALKNGLNHLREFDDMVEQMRANCKQHESILKEKRTQTSQTSESIDLSLKESEQQRKEVDELRKLSELKRSEMLKKSGQLELELTKVLPMLEASKTEIRQHLKPEALNEIKTLRAPPKTIKDILDALFIFLGAQDFTWASMKSYLASKSLRDELTNYNFEQRINQGMLQNVRSLMSQREASFNLDQAKRASKAIVPLLNWIRSALEYSQILVKTGPLREELQSLNSDITKSNELLKKSMAHLEQIDCNIQMKEKDLSDLRTESGVLEKQLRDTQQQLQDLQMLRVNLENQSIRWDQDLHKINSLVAVDPSCPANQLVKLCFMATELAFAGGDKDFSSPYWLENKVQGRSQMIDFICDGPFGLALDLDVEPSCKLLSDEETKHLIQLVSLKQFIELAESPWLPLISLDDECEETSEEEILDSLCCYGNVLGFYRKDISYMRFNQNHRKDLDQLQQMHSRTPAECRLSGRNRLICLDLRKMDPQDQLDLANFLFETSKQSSSESGSCKFVLVASLSCKFVQILARYMIRFHIVSRQANDIHQVQATILNYMLKLREPYLTDDLERKQMEVREKQRYMKTNETNLLNQLVSIKTTTTTGGNFLDVVRVLGKLQQLNQELANDWKMLEDLKRIFDSKRSHYFASSLESAKFYINLLAPSIPLKSFSRFSVKKYAQLLLQQQQQSKQPAVDDDAIWVEEVKTNKKLIVRHAMFSMNPKQRLNFDKQLRDAKLDETSCCRNEYKEDVSGIKLGNSSQVRRQQLGDAILRDVLTGTNRSSSCSSSSGGTRAKTNSKSCKLIVVLHDPNESSSPQRQLDYLFSSANSSGSSMLGANFEYHKVYATGDRAANQTARLEFALRKFASPSNNNNNNNNNNKEARKGRCLCVMNAHLSSGWLNANLLDCLENSNGDDVSQLISDQAAAASSSGDATYDQLRLLILIGEADSSSEITESLFDERILDYAQLRYWYDELALSLLDRFDTCCDVSSILPTQTLTELTCKDNDNIEEEEQIKLQLILLHVVCQERTKSPTGWLRTYNFDYDQLNLALKTLGRLLEAHHSNLQQAEVDKRVAKLRVRLGDYMADIVYGSRMESDEDELRLKKLIVGFLGDGNLAREKLRLLDELRRATSAGQQDLCNSLVKILIALPE